MNPGPHPCPGRGGGGEGQRCALAARGAQAWGLPAAAVVAGARPGFLSRSHRPAVYLTPVASRRGSRCT